MARLELAAPARVFGAAAANVLAVAFVAMLAASPALFGANVPLAWGLNAAGFGLIAAAYGLSRFWISEPPPAMPSLLPVLVPAGGVLVWSLLQAQPWTPQDWHHPVWREGSEALGRPLGGAVSANPSETRLGALRLATAIMVFVLAAQIARDRIWAARLVLACAAVPAAWSVAAVAARSAQVSLHPYEMTWRAIATDGQLTGPFINQNHFAIYLGLGLIAAWSHFIAHVGRSPMHAGLGQLRALTARALELAGQAAIYGLLFLPLFVGILLTGSRAGLLLSGCSMVGITVLWLVRAKRARRRQAVAAAVAVAVLAGALGLLAHGSRVGRELGESDYASDVTPRLAVVMLAARAIGERPMLGHGYATFADVFPTYRDNSVDIDGRWEEAHNSYVEAMLGLGLPAAVVMLATIVAVIARCALGALKRRRNRLAPITAVGAAVLIGVHALIDFSIQIQGVTLLFATLLGAGFAQSSGSGGHTVAASHARRDNPGAASARVAA